MNAPLKIDMMEATRLTREGRLKEAMVLLRGVLNVVPSGDAPTDFAGGARRPSAEGSPCTIDMAPPSIETGNSWMHAGAGRGSTSPSPTAGSMLEFLNRRGRSHRGDALFGLARPASRGATAPVAHGARFEERSFANGAGRRTYKLYVPSGYAGQALPLVVMMHGCTQSPDDFAAGTGMNALAEEQVFLVAYPAQAQSANVSKCWNWFSVGDQQRDLGEPSLIAGLTRQIMREFPVLPGRVYVAGLSAGGAAAAVLGAEYPDLYAAVGVHSGLACGAATDLSSALTAMRQGGHSGAGPNGHGGSRAAVPTIVFHGDRDAIVNPINGDQVIAQARGAATSRSTIDRGMTPGGISYTRTVEADQSDRPILEQWVLHGAGHAWSGGNAAGSYTNPRGPDASREMIRFFLQQPSSARSPS
ncbi:MAG: PHB depolymerase family esterase [Pseudomonadota bacterium]|nr:PHB depolymerase family esterase [Pseudomonadota bacterium]